MHIGHLNDISDNFKTCKKRSEEIEIYFCDHLGLAESFKMMNRPDPTVTLFDGLFLWKLKR